MRKQKKIHFIYKTTNNKNGKYYIGMHSTNNIDDDYLGSGKQLWSSINYHGKENFTREILELCDSREKLKIREEEIVTQQIVDEHLCMNLRTGGQGGFSNKEHQQKCTKAGGNSTSNKFKTDLDFQNKVKSKLSKSLIKAHIKGIASTWQTSFSWKGKTHSDETKQKIGKSNSIHQKGFNNSQFGKCWITNEIINKKIYKGDEIPNGFRLGRVMK